MTDSVHSFKDYTGRDLSELPASEFSGQTVRRSCFSHETPDSVVFPPNMIGATFVGCNLVNCVIPSGNTTDSSCIVGRSLVQPDGFDWWIDAEGNPISKVGE